MEALGKAVDTTGDALGHVNITKDSIDGLSSSFTLFSLLLMSVLNKKTSLKSTIASKVGDDHIIDVTDKLKGIGIGENLHNDVIGQLDLLKYNGDGIFTNLTFVPQLLSSLSKNTITFKPKLSFNTEYDYIVVGGGSAGSVMASRLSENPCVTVLLLEAGGEQPKLTEIPSFARIFYGSPIDWYYKTVPQKYSAFGQKENRVIWNNGKGLGGSSILNAMLYIRGNKKNYDDWAAEGADGWSYKDVKPFFLKLEDNLYIRELDRGYHRSGGPLSAEKINYIPEIKNPILKATQDMGYDQVDINGRRQTGIFDTQATVRNQQRCSAYKAYVEPIRNRTNLDILTHAFARKILIKKQRNGANRAWGVEFDFLGTTHKVQARSEVIISNGALRTPQILMLSGIGPKEHLQELNIDVVADLPVGKNLQDHCASHLIYTIDDKITNVVLKNLEITNIMDYITERKGPLTAPNQITLLAFLDGLNTTANSRDFPRQEVYFAEYATIDGVINYNAKDEVIKKVYLPYLTKPVYVCFASLLQPHSRGEIKLSSKDPYDYPLFDPRYYEDDRDLKDVVKGMKICNAIANHPALKEVNAKLIEVQRSGFPGCEKEEGNEDLYLSCIAKQVVTTFWHIVGTARMGRRNDPRSVVDPELRVIGVESLRVINAAVMPIVPSANTNVPTIMVAEKAYDMMKKDIKCSGTRRLPKQKKCH